MKVQRIPAQITTVEDKIAGNISLTQIALFIVPVFWAMIIFTLFTPIMDLALYKLPVIIIPSLLVLTLAIRIKGKLILNWLIVLITYNTRAKYYIFDKNDMYLRTLDLPQVEKSQKKTEIRTKEVKPATHTPNLGELIRLDRILSNPNVSFSIKAAKKGGVYVALEQKS